jgi:LmbE family N-acetylglucosaminyl deacetylase
MAGLVGDLNRRVAAVITFPSPRRPGACSLRPRRRMLATTPARSPRTRLQEREVASRGPAHREHRGSPRAHEPLPVGQDVVVATLVFLHAHPDDEASQTSGTMARAVARGDRVVVVFATNGDVGTAPEDLAPGETVAERRRSEGEASAAVIGVHRVEWLGYADSGMLGWEQNSGDGAFAAADVDAAARAVAEILDEEGADVLVGYDWHGGYGHPDHVQVHRVAHRAADLAARRPRVLEATMNRDTMRVLAEAGREAGVDSFDPDEPMADGHPMGMPQAEISWHVDVRDLLDIKRAALECHASQTSDVGMMLAMPAEIFETVFGSEHYVEAGRPDGMVDGWPLGS